MEKTDRANLNYKIRNNEKSGNQPGVLIRTRNLGSGELMQKWGIQQGTINFLAKRRPHA